MFKRPQNLKGLTVNLVWAFLQGGHKPGKHGKRGVFREFEKLSKSQENSGKILGNLNFCIKNLENSGKMKNMLHDHQKKCTFFSLELLRGKAKISWKSQGKLGEFSFSKM